MIKKTTPVCTRSQNRPRTTKETGAGNVCLAAIGACSSFSIKDALKLWLNRKDSHWMPSRDECKQPVNTARICLTQMPSPRHCLRRVLHFLSSPFNAFPSIFLLNYYPGILIRSASLPFPAAMTLLSICRVCILFFHLLFLFFSVCCLPPFLLILLPPTLLSSSRLSFSLLFFFAEQFVICLLPRLCFFIFFFSTVFFSHYLSCSFHLLISSHLPIFLPLSTRSLTFFFPLFNPLR